MIRANISEQFPIVASLYDEDTLTLATGQTVLFDVRAIDDSPLVPPVSGTLSESTVEPGIYKEHIQLTDPGNYICYVTCPGFLTNTEEIIINPENIYEIAKRTNHYNLSVEDVRRMDEPATPSQIARKVPLGATDYVINKIKDDDALDWTEATASGTVYAHYTSTSDKAPYKMGGPF